MYATVKTKISELRQKYTRNYIDNIVTVAESMSMMIIYIHFQLYSIVTLRFDHFLKEMNVQ